MLIIGIDDNYDIYEVQTKISNLEIRHIDLFTEESILDEHKHKLNG